jgi:ribonuclease E
MKAKMAKKMLIDATHAEETRVVVVDGQRVEEFDFESLNKRQLAGNIYLAKVTRVEPSLQAAFVDYGGNRHGFLAFSEIHPDYYQIPKADRDALLAEEAALALAAADESTRERSRSRPRVRRKKSIPAELGESDAMRIADDIATTENVPLDDVPPPSAASGELEIEVFEEPESEEAYAPQDTGSEYEAIGGDDVEEERRPQKPRQRRYKIQEVIKVRQILLVQVVKEERGNKGAALTTYLSLAGRYCVLMPNTARGGGISRKITNAVDRKKLKEIAGAITVPQGAGLIIRTAGANRTKTEIKRDYEYLLRQWEQIRDLTLKSIAPALIYEEGSLIKRVIRDLYSRDIDEVLVDGERGYREAKDYMKMLMPSHSKNVKHYTDVLPLFSRFQVESYLNAMFNPVVQLKSGGYIVIDVTEALVAIDVNSGRATREASIEDTALKTNLEAAEEAARQMRLRDLAGLIVIDFIDMEDRKNNAAVEKRLKDKLKSDRARIQVGRISGFGLLEMSRQRLRPGMIEATTKACQHCHGTGRVRSDDSLALALLREVEEEGVRQRSKEVLIVAPVDIANYLLNQKREHIIMVESRFGLSVRVEGDAALVSPDYRIERFKTASRIIPAAPAPSLPQVSYPEEEPEIEEPEEADVEEPTAGAGEERPAGKRRRRRRRRGGARVAGVDEVRMEPLAAEEDLEEASPGVPENEEADRPVASTEAGEAPSVSEETTDTASEAASAVPATKGRRRRQRPRDEKSTSIVESTPFGDVIDLGTAEPAEVVDVPETTAAAPRRARERVRKPVEVVLAAADAQDASKEPLPDDVRSAAQSETVEVVEQSSTGEPTVEAKDEVSELASASVAPSSVEDAESKSSAPKRRGWWSRALGGGLD